MMKVNSLFLVVVCLFLTTFIFAREPKYKSESKKIEPAIELRETCNLPTAFAETSINNVRAYLWNGGDVWWNRTDGRYVVPKVNAGDGVKPVSSLYAGAVWIIGQTPGGLKGAVRAYGRGEKNDFRSGPLTDLEGEITKETCANWDRMFEVRGANIKKHLDKFEKSITEGIPYTEDQIPIDVKSWPAKGNPYFQDIFNWELPFTSAALAPFFDADGDAAYNPVYGDYPIIEVRGVADKCKYDSAYQANPPYADQMFFWIYNDNAGPHTEFNGSPIKMEIQVQSYAWVTSDALNDMTFLRYKLINRSPVDISDCFFGWWVDGDLGCSTDDYIGCDTARSLVYYYNKDAVDGINGAVCDGVATYDSKIPIVGIDYFEGPTRPDPNGGPNIDIGMTYFTYYNNGSFNNPPTVTTDPSNLDQCYSYLRGYWKDGITRFTKGGTAFNPNSTDYSNYVYPSDPNDPSGWNMVNTDAPDYDRRTLQVTGPIELQKSARNYIVVGVPWVANQKHPAPSLTDLRLADDICQGLFDNCFQIFDGPDAPDLDLIELDKELVLTLSNDPTSNNYNLDYKGFNPGKSPCEEDSCLYHFEGYKVFQLVNGSDENLSDLSNLDKARLLFQVDVKNNITVLYNWFPLPNPSPVPDAPKFIWIPTLQVQGNNKGINNTFEVVEDLFAKTSDKRLKNHTKYYYATVAYARNEYLPFDPVKERGQNLTYAQGRGNIRVYEAIPRPITDRYLNAKYGDGSIITRLDGKGNYNSFLELAEGETERLAKNSSNTNDDNILYMEGFGPVQVKIYNPIDVKDGEFVLKVEDDNMSDNVLDVNTAWWSLKDKAGNVVVNEQKFSSFNERLIADYGFSIFMNNNEPGEDLDKVNGFIGQKFEYADSSNLWMSFLQDNGSPFTNWINVNAQNFDFVDPDPEKVYESLPLFPAVLAFNKYTESTDIVIQPVGYDANINSLLNKRTSLKDLNNVNIVFTSNRDLWTRCIVVETSNAQYTTNGLPNQGNTELFAIRRSPSIGKDVDANGNPVQESGTGLSWFPGYAIDVETGQRLEVFFGENSSFDPLVFGDIFAQQGIERNSGRDMVWNPGAKLALNPSTNTVGDFYVGGGHFIYVTNRPYDEATFKAPALGNLAARANFYASIRWIGVGVPSSQLLSYKDGLIPNELTLKTRVNNSYQTSPENTTGANNSMPLYNIKIIGKTAGVTDAKLTNKALDSISVVPNPYYAYNEYEVSEISNVVKITNLPPQCLVTIYSLDGKFIRQFNRNESPVLTNRPDGGVNYRQIVPDIEWDLKNDKGITVASGVYLIHVKTNDGERVIKWVGAIRQLEISGF